MTAGVVHGALLLTTVGAVLGALHGQLVRGLPIGALAGIGGALSYYVIVAVPVVRDALGLAWPQAGLVRGLGWALVATTLASMLDRLRRLAAVRRARGSPA